jgi:arylsulfatase A-like enzyme
MASALKSAGYKTIHLGKYHIGPDPLTQGFDINIGGNEAGGPRHGGYFSPWKGGAMEKFSAQYPKGTHRMDVFADQCIRFMKAHLDRPMFIHLSPYSVHGRLEAIPGLVEKYDKAKVHPIYASMVEKMDQCIGDVLKAIDELGIKNNTLVVFSSDNGGICAIQSQSPYRAGKGSYYEGGIRKPMVVRWPNKIKAGSRCHTPVSSLDFYPTFLDIAQSTVPKNKILDGLSLMPLFTQSGSWPNRALYWHFPIYLQAYQKGRDGGRDPLFRTRPGSALRYGKWKLHEYFEDGVLELYNLESDLGEQVDLSTSLPEKTTELKTMLDQWREKTRGAVPTQLNPNFDPHFKD